MILSEVSKQILMGRGKANLNYMWHELIFIAVHLAVFLIYSCIQRKIVIKPHELYQLKLF